MDSKNSQINLLNMETPSLFNGLVILNKEKFIEILNSTLHSKELSIIKTKIQDLINIISAYKRDVEGILNIESNGDTITLRRNVLVSELKQILDSQTDERATYYIKRLLNGIQKVKTNKINDINLLRWKEYDEIITDSLWILDKRDSSGAHLGWYWGNFIPQIPRQLMLRYTKKYDWVLDAFAGSGTTLIECRRLGRNGLGIELNPDVAEKAKSLIQKEENKFQVVSDIIVGDSRTIDLKTIFNQLGIKKVQLLIMHPPYHDIIKFSKNEKDLSNAKDIDEFLRMFGEVIDNISPYLEKNRFFALVIGDKYSRGEWIPLGFYCMQEVLKRKFQLKSIIVKNFDETRGKRNQKELWRYRALVGGFYVFKHEYIMLFKKV